MLNKDKNHPKAPMSAYACFVQVIREEYKKKHPNEDIVFNEFAKKCGERWKQMTPDQRCCFEEMAKLDLDRFNREMAHYVPPMATATGLGSRRGGRGRRRRFKDPAMPKRSWSAFFFFCDANRAKIRRQHPDWKVSQVAKELGRKWEECSDKAKYERHAHDDKLRYEQDMQKYKAGVYVTTKRAKVEEEEEEEDGLQDGQDNPEDSNGNHQPTTSSLNNSCQGPSNRLEEQDELAAIVGQDPDEEEEENPECVDEEMDEDEPDVVDPQQPRQEPSDACQAMAIDPSPGVDNHAGTDPLSEQSDSLTQPTTSGDQTTDHTVE